MSNSQRLRHLLKQIQIKLTSLGPTNRARWTAFSTGNDMSVAQFARRVATYNIKISTTDTATMWKAVGISGNQLNFAGFEKIISAETAFPQKSPAKEETTPLKRPSYGQQPEEKPVKTPQTPLNSTDKIQTILFSSRRALLMKCLDADPLTLGRIDKTLFADIIAWFGISDRKSVVAFSNSLEEDNSGYVNYIAFVDFLCSMNDDQQDAASVVSSPMKYEANEHSYDEIEEYESPNAAFKRTPPSPLNPSYSVPPVDTTHDLPSEIQNKYYSPEKVYNSPSAQSLMRDPLIFGEYSQRRVGGSAESLGPRRNLDPDIFGPKPHREEIKVQRLQSADEVKTAERFSRLTPGQVVQLLSTKIFEQFKNSKAAYGKWKTGDLLTVDDLRDGFARDCNVNIAREDLLLVINHYGGPMTMSTFTRMLSDGSRLNEISKSPGGMLKETEDEEMLNDIAGQIKKGGWEDIIFRCSSAEEIAEGFATLGVSVTPEVIHILASKYGKRGLIDALEAKTH